MKAMTDQPNPLIAACDLGLEILAARREVVGLRSKVTTGHHPLWWLGHLLVILEAALFCAGRVLAQAAVQWWRRMPGVLAELRAEFAGNGGARELEKILREKK